MNRKRDLRAFMVLVVVMLASLLVGKVQQARAMAPDDIPAMRQTQPADLSTAGRFIRFETEGHNQDD